MRRVEVIANDFLIIGHGKTNEEGLNNRDDNLKKILHRCREKSLHLNTYKVQFKESEINYIAHVLHYRITTRDKIAKILVMRYLTTIK